jgi:hypothetical protein
MSEEMNSGLSLFFPGHDEPPPYGGSVTGKKPEKILKTTVPAVPLSGPDAGTIV